MKQKLRHIRAKDKDGAILSKGGATVAALVDDNGIVVKYAVSYCHCKDNFRRIRGKGRADSMLNSVDQAIDGNGYDWNTITKAVDTEVGQLRRAYLIQQLAKIDHKRNALDRRINALSSQLMNV